MALKKVPLKKLDDGIPNSVLRYVFNIHYIKGLFYICSPILDREMKALQECEDSHHVCKTHSAAAAVVGKAVT